MLLFTNNQHQSAEPHSLCSCNTRYGQMEELLDLLLFSRLCTCFSAPHLEPVHVLPHKTNRTPVIHTDAHREITCADERGSVIEISGSDLLGAIPATNYKKRVCPIEQQSQPRLFQFQASQTENADVPHVKMTPCQIVLTRPINQ